MLTHISFIYKAFQKRKVLYDFKVVCCYCMWERYKRVLIAYGRFHTGIPLPHNQKVFGSIPNGSSITISHARIWREFWLSRSKDD